MTVPDQIDPSPLSPLPKTLSGWEAPTKCRGSGWLVGVPLRPNRGLIEASREAPQGLATCWLFWEEPHRRPQAQAGLFHWQACGVRLGAGGRPAAQPRQIFLNQAPQGRGGGGCKDPRAPEGLQHLLPFHGPPETLCFC